EELVTVPIIIQRHGAARSRSKWKKGEKSRPLNSKGKKQAKALPHLIDAFDPGPVLSSPWKRCRDTVEPFTRLEGLKIATKHELPAAGHRDHPPRTTATAERALREPRRTRVCPPRPPPP